MYKFALKKFSTFAKFLVNENTYIFYAIAYELCKLAQLLFI